MTGYGELAVMCPTCPHRGINTDVVEKLRKISPELADAAPYVQALNLLAGKATELGGDRLFNDRVHLSMDCNFRAKNRMTRSTPETSPYLGDGMAYMVPEEPYEEYTRSCLNDAEVSDHRTASPRSTADAARS